MCITTNYLCSVHWNEVLDCYISCQLAEALLLLTNAQAIAAFTAVIVSQDSDFYQRCLLYGHPPKFIYLRIGNCPTARIIQILRNNFDIIRQFGDREAESILVLA